MRIVGWALIAAGALGLYSRFNVYSANQAGSTGNVSPLANYDPATLVLNIAPTGNLLDAGTIVDALVVGAGWYILQGGFR
jgi:hypothetical protein